MLVITSMAEESRGLKYDNDVVVSADVVDDEVERDLAESERRNRLPQIWKDRAKNVRPEALNEVWAALRDLGIEEFPVHPGGRPPEDVPSITVMDDHDQWIFLKWDAKILALDPDEQRRLAGIWTQCQYTLVNAYSL